MKKTAPLLALFLLSFTFSLSAQTKDIHEAIKDGNIDQVKSILEANPEAINSTNVNGWPPINHACYRAHLTIIDYLLEQGASIYSVNEIGATTVHWTVHGFGKAKTKEEIVDYLLKKAPDLASIPTDLGIYPLHWSGVENEKTISLLLENGADIDAKDKNGYTALHHWIKWWKQSRDEFLISKGANVNAKDNNGQAPLHASVITGRIETTKMLIENGSEINTLDNYGYTVLDYASKFSHNSIKEFIIANGGTYGNKKESERLNKLHHQKLHKNEAALWYCDEDGWVVNTKTNTFIFNYPNWGIQPEFPGLSNGRINIKDLSDKHITVFGSNKRTFDRSIPGWKEINPNISFVLGFTKEELPNAIVMNGNSTKKINDFEIHAIESTSEDIGYIIKIDDLVIYHAGNFSIKEDSLKASFIKEIDRLSNTYDKIDIAIMPTQLLGVDNENVLDGILYTLEKLKPKVFFPSFQGPSTTRFRLKEIAHIISEKNLGIHIICPDNRGDRFFYKEGNID